MNKIHRIFKLFLLGFIFLNILAIIHAYKFTHFTDEKGVKTKNPENLSTLEKLKPLLLGINNPRPKTIDSPSQFFKTTILQSNKKIEIWEIENRSIYKDSVKGTVIIFHGYGGSKSKMIYKSDNYQHLGYHTVLVDFMGSGGSEGIQTTIGYKEAEEVKSVYEYILSKGEENIILAGTSMGAVAIMKSIKDYNLKPQSIVLECPFGTMSETVNARFQNMKAPIFPMANLLVFWGGIINGFWAFDHNPTEYAKTIDCPTLLLYGAQDKNVSQKETDEIFKNLNGKKHLKIYPNHGHERYPEITKTEIDVLN